MEKPPGFAGADADWQEANEKRSLWQDDLTMPL
jgi:hypothetical protein